MPLVHFESGGYSHYGLTLSHCNIVTLHSHCPIGLKVLPYFFSYQISLPNFLAFLRTCHCQPKLTWRRLSFVSVFGPLWTTVFKVTIPLRLTPTNQRTQESRQYLWNRKLGTMQSNCEYGMINNDEYQNCQYFVLPCRTSLGLLWRRRSRPKEVLNGRKKCWRFIFS